MPLLLTPKPRTDSDASVASSQTRSSTSSLQTWYRKRKRMSPSPSPPSEDSSTDSSRASTWRTGHGPNGSRSFHQAQHISAANIWSRAQGNVTVNRLQSMPQGYTTSNTDRNDRLDKPEQSPGLIPSSRPPWRGRRRSSTRLSGMPAPQDFAATELEKPLVLSRPACPIRVGHVYRPHPEPGWRVATKPRSPESCFTTTRPLYSARYHSPSETGRPFTIYYEAENRPSSSEDGICLALGFTVGRDRASRMPGFENGSIGIHCNNGGLYMNDHLLKSAATTMLEPGEQLGIGMTFSKGEVNAHSSTMSSSSIEVEVFLTKDGTKAGSWNLGQLMQSAGSLFEGFDGNHDLYAAVGTRREVNVDILFDRIDWRYHPEAE